MSAAGDRRQFLGGALALTMSACARAAPGGPARVALGPRAPGPVIAPALFGSNLQWTARGDGALAARPGGGLQLSPALVARVREAGLTLLRFPGGALANTYRWRNGIGPGDHRPPGLNFAGQTEPSSFGVDEYLALLAASNARPLITVNVAAGSEEAADWVEYMNGSKQRGLGALRQSHTGLGPAGALWWEVGNELFSPKEPGYRAAADYAATVIAFRDAMRARDPSIKVGAMLEGSFQSAAWMRSVMPHLLTWNSEVLRATARQVDFVSLHFSAPNDTLWSADEQRELTLSANRVLGLALDDVGRILAQAGRPELPILVTEYTAYYGGAPSPRIAGTEGALFDALVLFEMMRRPKVQAAANWSLANNSTFGLLEGEGAALKPRPSYHVLQALSGFAGLPRAPLDIQGPAYDVQAKGNVPALQGVGLIDGVAALAGPGLYRLALVNRSARAAVPVQLVDLVMARGALRAEADDPLAHAAPIPAGSQRLTLPPGSLAVLEARVLPRVANL